MSWATQHIQKLQTGETIKFRPRGNSMVGKISSGQALYRRTDKRSNSVQERHRSLQSQRSPIPPPHQSNPRGPISNRKQLWENQRMDTEEKHLRDTHQSRTIRLTNPNQHSKSGNSHPPLSKLTPRRVENEKSEQR